MSSFTVYKRRLPRLRRTPSVIKKFKAVFHWDWLTCACRNDASLYGFYESDKNGNAKLRQYGEVRGGQHLGCNHCGAVIKTPKGFPYRNDKTLVSVTKFATVTQLNRAHDIINGFWEEEIYTGKRGTTSRKRGKTGKKRNRKK